MAIIWAEGFDHYGTVTGGRPEMLAGAWSDFQAGNGTLPNVNTTRGRTGTKSLQMLFNSLATDSVTARRVLGAAHINVGCAAGFYFNALPNTNGGHGFEFRNNANSCIAFLSIQSDGAIGLYTGSARTLVATSSPVITAAAWQHIEAKVLIDSIVGAVEVRVNGTTVINATDLNLGLLGATQLCFGMPKGKVGGDLTYYIDDIVPWNDNGTKNNNFLGPARVQTYFASGDAVTADFTKNGAAAGWDCINDVPNDGDTSYLAGSIIGATSEFTLPALAPETSSIAGIYIPTMAKLEGAGVGNLQTSLVSGASVSNGPDTPLTTAYTYWPAVLETDPATGNNWTKASVEAAKLRLKKTA